MGSGSGAVRGVGVADGDLCALIVQRSPNITVKSSQVMPNRVWWALDKVDSERLHSTPNTSRGNDSRDGYWEDGYEVRFVFCTFCLLSSRAEKDHEKEVG